MSGLVISTASFLFFTFTYLAESIYFNDPRHQNADLRPWMTPRYVSLSYDLPREVVLDVLQIDPEGDSPKRLDRIARQNGVTLTELTQQIQTKADAYRESVDD